MPMAEKKSPRYVFIDLLRGLAVFVMVEVHVVNALLLPGLRSGDFFRVLNFINGIVAPSFIFIAGFAFAISADRKWTDYTRWNSKPLGLQFRRLGLILLIGYLLHLPYFSFRKLVFEASAADWEKFFQSDVLQCIAVSLIILQVAVLVLKKPAMVYLLALVLGMIFIFLTPVIWNIDFALYLPLPAAAYFNKIHSPLFPLFPWAGYLMFGAAAGYGFVLSISREKVPSCMKWIAILGAAGIAGGLLINFLPVHVYEGYDFWRTSPEYVFVRLGIVFLLLAGLWLGEHLYHYSGGFLTKIGQESLITYTAHLVIIYGSVLGEQSIASSVGKTQGWGSAFAISAALILAMIALAYIWNWLKKKHHLTLRIVQYAGTAVFFFLFFYRKY